MRTRYTQGSGLLCLFSVAYLFFALWSGCGSFTVMNHPEVEVYDPKSRQFFIEEVTLHANCASCHEALPDKFGEYAKLSRLAESASDPNSPSQLDAVAAKAFSSARRSSLGAEMRGYSNFSDSPFGYYYHIPWWYDEGIPSSLFIGESVFDRYDPFDSYTRHPSVLRESFRRDPSLMPFGSFGTPIVPPSFTAQPLLPLPLVSPSIVVPLGQDNPSRSNESPTANSASSGSSTPTSNRRESERVAPSSSSSTSTGSAAPSSSGTSTTRHSDQKPASSEPKRSQGRSRTGG